MLITFVIILRIATQEQPMMYQEIVPDIAACQDAVVEFTSKIPEAANNGGMLQVGCIIEVPPSRGAQTNDVR